MLCFTIFVYSWSGSESIIIQNNYISPTVFCLCCILNFKKNNNQQLYMVYLQFHQGYLDSLNWKDILIFITLAFTPCNFMDNWMEELFHRKVTSPEFKTLLQCHSSPINTETFHFLKLVVTKQCLWKVVQNYHHLRSNNEGKTKPWFKIASIFKVIEATLSTRM